MYAMYILDVCVWWIQFNYINEIHFDLQLILIQLETLTIYACISNFNNRIRNGKTLKKIPFHIFLNIIVKINPESLDISQTKQFIALYMVAMVYLCYASKLIKQNTNFYILSTIILVGKNCVFFSIGQNTSHTLT